MDRASRQRGDRHRCRHRWQRLERGGYFRVVEIPNPIPQERIVGCMGLYPLNQTDIELRKMYLLPIARGQGIGRRLLNDAIDEARRRGFRHLRLETASVLHEAISLYRSAGFQRIPHAEANHRCDQTWALALMPQALSTTHGEIK